MIGDATTAEAPSRRCVCYKHADARTCYELRYYGYSPIAREENDWTREWGVRVDEDGECECSCHDGADDDDDW